MPDPVAVQDEGAGKDALDCKLLMIVSRPDRETRVSLFPGYMTHKRGDEAADLEASEAVNMLFLNKFLIHPAASTFTTMEAAFNT